MLLGWPRRRFLAIAIGALLPGAAAAKKHKKHHGRGGGGGGGTPTPPSPPLRCDPTAASGIAGLVLLGPTCPVVRPDDPCPDRPFVAAIVVRNAQGTAVCTTSSGEDGRFRVGLPAGTYELDPQSGDAGGLPSAASQQVTVEPGRYTEVLVSFDSGIRSRRPRSDSVRSGWPPPTYAAAATGRPGANRQRPGSGSGGGRRYTPRWF